MELTDKPVMHWFTCEILVAYQFSKQDYLVSVPLSPCEYDMVVDTHERLVRVQVKKGMFHKQRIRPQGKGDRDHWTVDLTKKKRNGSGYSEHQRIATEEFDYLAVVCNETTMYVIPKKLLLAPEEPQYLMRAFHIKEPLAEGRADSMKAGERWEPYRNQFHLEKEPQV